LYGLSQEYNAITQEIAGKIQITFNSNNANNNRRNMTGENFIRLSALMAHEVGVHQDNPNSTREEEIAQLVEAVVLKEQQAAGAEIIATGNSRYQRGHNDLLLALNMSGANTFPGRVGLKQSAGVDNIAPDSPPNTVVQGGKFQSFDHLMTTLYANLGATVRPAHPITQTILRRITGDPDLVVTQFDDALIDELDRIGVYPAEDAVQVASWFKLSNSSAAPA
jgi:hypothetical protein